MIREMVWDITNGLVVTFTKDNLEIIYSQEKVPIHSLMVHST